MNSKEVGGASSEVNKQKCVHMLRMQRGSCPYYF